VRPNIRDIAEAAGVSVTTVSHALSGHGRVAVETRERIQQIAREMSYSANVHAQRLASGRSRTLGIQIACFTTDASGSRLLPEAAYFMELLNGAASAAGELDYALLLAPYDCPPSVAAQLAIDGVIVVDPAGDEFVDTALHERGAPVVTTGRPTSGAARFSWVDNDHGRAARRMFDHFLARGYSRPALVATTRNRSYVADIMEAYAEWTREHDVRPIVVELGEPPTERAAARAARRLLSRQRDRPDAVYATFDRLALGVLLQAERLGISVPGDFALASAVDSDALRWATPHITASTLDPTRIGQEAVRVLVDLIEGREQGERRVIVPTGIKPRASTARRASGAAAKPRRRAGEQREPLSAPRSTRTHS
jgi:DNA-binding LacI/PurR family transcriptional regulator